MAGPIPYWIGEQCVVGGGGGVVFCCHVVVAAGYLRQGEVAITPEIVDIFFVYISFFFIFLYSMRDAGAGIIAGPMT